MTALYITLLVSGCSQSGSPYGEHQPPDDCITLVAVGDIMLGGTAEEIMLKNDYDYPFQKTSHLFANADIVIGNLEGPLTNIESSALDKEYIFRSPPESVAPALSRAGFNVMNLANNHTMDYGVGGMNDTIDSLKQNGIFTLGAGENRRQARKGIVLNTHYGRVALLSYSLTFPEDFWATDERAGTAFGHKKDIQEDVQRLSQQADYIIVSFHWGREKTTTLRPYQPTLAHAAIDAGADVVVGHHPHVLQAVERYKNGIILYSLGNYVFGSYSKDAATSMVARITLHKGMFYSAELIPIKVLNTEVVFQPYPLKGHAASKVIRHINQLSQHTQTHFKLINNRGYLHTRSNKIQSLTHSN